MAKHPLTYDGIAAWRAELYSRDNAAVLAEASVLLEDLTGWMAARFELQVCVLEWLRAAPESESLFLACTLAQAMLSRRPVIMQGQPEGSRPALLIVRHAAVARYDFRQGSVSHDGETSLQLSR